MIQDAVIRQLEVLGEAATRTSEETQRRHDDVPWRDVTGMRNKLIHGYFGSTSTSSGRPSQRTSPG